MLPNLSAFLVHAFALGRPGKDVGWVMEHQEEDPRSLTGFPMFVSHQPPDQHLPGHPFHGREQILCPVSLPAWWDAVGRDPAPTQLGPHGLLQVGWGGAVSR